jgi:hypothetical protein
MPARGIPRFPTGTLRIERLVTDNALAYCHSTAIKQGLSTSREAQVHQAALPMAKRQGRAV